MAQSQNAGTTVREMRPVGLAAQRNIFTKTWWILRRYPVIPGIIIVGLIVMGVFAPQLEPMNPIQQRLNFRNYPPTWGAARPEYNSKVPNPADYDMTSVLQRTRYKQARNASFTRTQYILGADEYGRDVLSRVIEGARISLMLASVALVSGTIVGTAMGLAAGYFGGWVDEVLMRVLDLWLGLPFLLLALVLVIVLGNSLQVMMVLLALLAWVPFVRQVRADVLVVRTREYVDAARIAGASNLQIMWRHILPGTYSTILVVASLRVGGLILAAAALSFLGAGIPDPTPDWGKMVAEGREFLATAWWISFWPGFAIFLVVMSLNFFGDWLRDRLDPRLAQID